MSIRFGPGISPNASRQVINNKNSQLLCMCPKPNNKKVLLTSANNSTGTTQTQREVNAILYSSGGTINYGNNIRNNIRNRNINTLATFLGRTEGQPGGTLGPLRNRF